MSQVEMIQQYHDYLTHNLGMEIELNQAAIIWSKKMAILYRNRHPFEEGK